jgi:hypothetical protein
MGIYGFTGIANASFNFYEDLTMAKQTKPPAPHNRVVAIIHHGKNLRMIEAKELDWSQIFAGEGIGNGKQKKDVEMAFYLNANDDVIMKYPPNALKVESVKSAYAWQLKEAHIASAKNGAAKVAVAKGAIEEDLPWDNPPDPFVD